MSRRPLRALVFVLASFGLACGFLGDTIGEKVGEKVGEEAVEAAMEKSLEAQGNADAKVELDQGKMQVQSAQGTVTMQTGSTVPADFPADVPIYPGASVESSVNASGPEGGGWVVGFKTADGPDKVSAFYKEKLGASLANKAEMNMNGEIMLVYGSPDEKRSVQVMIKGAEGGGSQVGLTVLGK